MTIDNNYNDGKLNIIDILFIAFCMFPFIIPNPIVTTNIQPYAAVIGILVIFIELFKEGYDFKLPKPRIFLVALLTFAVSVVVLFLTEITMSSFRALFNYLSVAIIPLAWFLILRRLGRFPEKIIKVLIFVWFVVATVQFFFDRSFLTAIISGVRFSYTYRGVVGLASEPSFLGIACFYFLHLISKFKKHQLPFFIMVLIMGIIYAQSMMGVLFIAAFLAIYLLDSTNTKRGVYIWIAAVIVVVGFWIVLNTALTDTRLYKLILTFMEEGTEGVLEDQSAGNRYDSLAEAIRASFENYLLPLGYTRRIGSGYGGFLCELGIFALPVLFFISHSMALSFDKKVTRVLYFALVTILMFNNTQVGNPLLLMVLATNLSFSSAKKHDGITEEGGGADGGD